MTGRKENMLLLVDAGNTRIKWATVDPAGKPAPGQWAQSGMVARADIAGLADTWNPLGITRVLLSNVAGTGLRDELEKLLSHVLGMDTVPCVWFKSQAELAGLRSAYRDPQQLGCDRFASAIGARALYPYISLMVVTCGTATTVDCISADGVFAGGMIFPGLGTMAASLASNTAQLPHVPQAIQIRQPFADNTQDAIISGCINAQAGAIERAMALYRQQHADAICLLSGGAADMISPSLSIDHQRVDNLVLVGLQTVALLPEKSC